MRTLLKLLILISINTNTLFAQSSGWITTPGSPYDFGHMIDVSFINPNTGWTMKPNGSIYKTTNGGINWQFLDSIGNFPSFTSIAFSDENTGWIGSNNPARNIFKTTNGGMNWAIVTNIPLPLPPGGFEGISTIGDSLVFGVGSYVAPPYFIKSTNRGASWESINLNSYATVLLDCIFFSKDSGFVIGGIGNIPNQTKAVALFTSNGGSNWNTVFTGAVQRTWCYRISFPDRINGYICLEAYGVSPSFLKSTNGGMNWSELNLRTRPYTQQAIGFKNANTGWIGGWSDTTFQTTDGGNTWTPADFGVNLNNFHFFGDSIGYAAGQYIYKMDKTIGIKLISTEIPEDFILHQNYPNPFNPTTKINYELPASRGERVTNYVSVIVYDILGNEVSSLVNQKQNVGSYEVDFSGSNLPSGIYFYSLSVDGNLVDTKRMILLK